jgi:hypothetical protein
MLLGSVFGHAVAYSLLTPAHGSHTAMNHEHGAGVFPHIETCLAVCGTVALIALGASLAGRIRFVAPVWFFALVPPLGFAMQEYLVEVLQTNAFQADVALEPTFLLGLLLQLPFALAAYAAARGLLTLARTLVELLRTAPALRVLAITPSPSPAPKQFPVLIPALARGYGERGPPAGAL